MKFLHNYFSYAKNDIISTVVLLTTEIIEPYMPAGYGNSIGVAFLFINNVITMNY